MQSAQQKRALTWLWDRCSDLNYRVTNRSKRTAAIIALRLHPLRIAQRYVPMAVLTAYALVLIAATFTISALKDIPSTSDRFLVVLVVYGTLAPVAYALLLFCIHRWLGSRIARTKAGSHLAYFGWGYVILTTTTILVGVVHADLGRFITCSSYSIMLILLTWDKFVRAETPNPPKKGQKVAKKAQESLAERLGMTPSFKPQSID